MELYSKDISVHIHESAIEYERKQEYIKGIKKKKFEKDDVDESDSIANENKL